jgi:transposase
MRVFTERLENTAPRYARRTRRSAEALDWIALALGGQAGSRLALHLGLSASGSTLLRLLRRRAPSGPVRAPRVLGIDDWAWRKGHRYGTILCDLEAGTVVDLLPDREAETVAHWLRTHPGVEIVSRDRASACAEAARRAAPQAVQVADRWHVLRNLGQALTAALEPHHRMLTQAALAIRQPNTPPASVAPAVDAPARTAVLKRQNRERRHGRYEQVLELAGRGKNKRQIARELGLDRRTVRRWLHSDGFPERRQGCRSSTVDVHATYLDRRWEQGCHHAAQLWRELRERGFGGQQNIVRRWIRQRRGPRAPRGEHPVKAPAIRVSPRRVAWWLLTEPDFARPYLDELYRRAPHIAATASVAREFVRMVRERGFSAWSAWLQAARTTPLANFATYLARDQDAVLAALRLPWNNGPVEGQVHRLKLIKRQMYGRANFDLLRLRVLNTV